MHVSKTKNMHEPVHPDVSSCKHYYLQSSTERMTVFHQIGNGQIMLNNIFIDNTCHHLDREAQLAHIIKCI